MENKNTKIIVALIVVGFAFYWYVYRPEHIKQVCLMAYPESGPGSLSLPTPFAPNYSSCLRSYGLKVD